MKTLLEELRECEQRYARSDALRQEAVAKLEGANRDRAALIAALEAARAEFLRIERLERGDEDETDDNRWHMALTISRDALDSVRATLAQVKA